MKYSRTALGLLNAQYRSVLRKCMLINLGLFAITAIAATPANAADGDVISNGTAIAVGATIGTVEGLGSAAYTNSGDYATAAQGALADTALQENDNVSKLTNDAGYQNATQVGSAISTALGAYTTTADMNTLLSAKASVSNVYTKSEVETYVENNSVQTVNTSGASNGQIKVDGVTVTVYDDSALQSAVAGKADAATTYTQTQVNSLLDAKADVSNVYTKSQTETYVQNNSIQSVTGGSTNGTISVDGADVAVTGLGSAAYTASTAYATAAQGTLAETALQAADITTGTTNGTIKVGTSEVSVAGLGSAAYTNSDAYDAAGTAAGVQTAIEGKLDDGASGYDINAKSLKVQGDDVATQAWIGTQGYTTLNAVKTDAQSDTAGSLGATITSKANSAISDSVADTTTAGALGTLLAGKQATIDSTNTLDSAFINTTNYANSALETAVKGTKVNSATSADSATTLTGLTASVEELNYVDGVTSNIQTQLDGKTTLDAVKTDAASTTAGSLGATITSKANSAISTALGTGGDIATYVTNNAVQTVTAGTANGTISVDGGADVLIYNDADVKAEIAKRDVTISGGIATIKDGTDTAEVYTKNQADATFVGAAANNTFTGTNTFNGAVTMSSGLSITGGTLTAGASTLGATNASSLTSTGAIKGATLESTGNTKANSLEVTTTATVGQSLTVTGMTNANGGLTTSNLVLNGASLTDADTGASAVTTGSANTVATTATVLKSAEYATFTPGSSTALSGQTKIGAAINTLGTAVDTINTAITVGADGNYIKAADNVATNLGYLDTAVKNNADAIAGKADVADITVAAGTYNNITAGTNVAQNLVNLDATIGGAITGTGVLNGVTLGNGSGETSVASALQTVSNTIGKTSGAYAAGTALAGKTIGQGAASDVSVVEAVGTLNTAIYDITEKDGVQDGALADVYSKLNGGTYNKATGEVTGATALSGFTANNLTAAANELMTDIKVAANGNYITAGADVKGNLGALDTAIGKVATGTYNAISASNNVAANLQALDSAFTSGNIDASFDDTTVNSLKIGEANKISGSADTIDMNKNSLTNVKGITLTNGTQTASLNVNSSSNFETDAGIKAGSLESTGNLTVGGTATVTGAFTANGAVTLGSDSSDAISVLGTATFAEQINATNGIKAGANTTLTQNSLILSDGANTTALSATADGLNVNSGLKVNGNETVTGNATIQGTLSAGATTISASGAGATTALNVTAENSSDGSKTIFSVASDKASVTGNLGVSGTLGIGANTTMSESTTTKFKDYAGTEKTGQKVLEVEVGDAMAVNGVVAATNGFSVVSKTGTSPSATYTEVFNIDDKGSITSDTLKTDNNANTVTIGKDADTATNVLGKLSLNSTAATDPYVNAIDDGTTAQTTGGANTMATVATVLKSAENGAYTGASDKNIAADSTIKTAIGALDTEIGADSDYGTAAPGSALNNGVDGANSVKANIAAINDKLGNIPDTAVNGYDMTASGATLVGAVNKLDTNMEGVLGGIYNQTTGAYDNTALLNDTTPNGFETGATNLSDALTKYAENNQAATGVSYDADGSVATTYTKASAPKYDGLVAKSSLKSAIEQLDGNIGTVTNATHKNITASNTVNQNLDQIDAVLGDMYKLQADAKDTSSAMFKRGNLTNGATAALTTDLTVADALSNIDQTLGKIHGLVANADDTTTTTGVAYYGNLAVGTTVEEHIEAVDAAIGDRRDLGSKNEAINTGTKASVAAGIKAAGDAIGDMNFAQAHYVASENDLSGAVRSLDSNLYRVESDLHDLKRDFNRGMASMAAMSALVPNPRAHGNTSLAIGTGAYSGHTATAIGGFHYLTDNIMLNAGAAWGNSRDVSYRMGVTFSW